MMAFASPLAAVRPPRSLGWSRSVAPCPIDAPAAAQAGAFEILNFEDRRRSGGGSGARKPTAASRSPTARKPGFRSPPAPGGRADRDGQRKEPRDSEDHEQASASARRFGGFGGFGDSSSAGPDLDRDYGARDFEDVRRPARPPRRPSGRFAAPQTRRERFADDSEDVRGTSRPPRRFSASGSDRRPSTTRSADYEDERRPSGPSRRLGGRPSAPRSQRERGPDPRRSGGRAAGRLREREFDEVDEDDGFVPPAPAALENRLSLSELPVRPADRETLLGLPLSAMEAILKERGFEGYRGRQLHQYVYEKGARSVQEITVFGKQMREALADLDVGRLPIEAERETADGTVKMLLRLPDGNVIEAVGIPTASRLTVCVSSQVGCAMACDFCATGKGGFVRNLRPNEIVDQVLTIQERMQRRVANIVFMGMGEPLNNLENVLRAVRCLNEDVGIGQRNITISTVGVKGRIRELARYHLQCTLAVSLHAPNQEMRRAIIPTAEHYPIEELLAECREYVNTTGRRVSFEYTLLEGVNDAPESATELAGRLRGFQAHVNLIPWNPITDAEYRRPSGGRVQAFAGALEAKRVAVSVRRTRGSEKDAACGQLRASRAEESPAAEA